jgi:hypothetical protein
MMKDQKVMNEGPDENRAPMAYDQREGESNMWYDRFYRFCLYGSSRSLLQCYRDVMAEKEALLRLGAPEPVLSCVEGPAEGQASKEPPRPKRICLPGSWKKKVKEFDWWERAEAWDAERRRQAARRVIEALNMFSEASPEAAQFQINLMKGFVRLRNDAGEEEPVYLSLGEIQQMRLASNSILNRAGVVYDGMQAAEEDGKPDVIGIMIHRAEE